jgi:3-dehydroquinate dehydratase II
MPGHAVSTLLILNGPNLNLLGLREPDVYGRETLEDLHKRCLRRAKAHGLDIEFKQSNIEGDLINWIHGGRGRVAGIIINPAGLSFYSVSLLEALKAFDGPKIEVHLSNIHKRDPMYQKSIISHEVDGVIGGLGTIGYEFAVEAIAIRLSGTQRSPAQQGTISRNIHSGGPTKLKGRR